MRRHKREEVKHRSEMRDQPAGAGFGKKSDIS